MCPRCGEEYDDSTAFCAKDGTRLVPKGQTGVDLIGTVIADRYRIESKLGEGGMGQVYLAEHVRMKRKSAIKIMRNALLGDAEALQRFTREAESASQISHPNVAAIYDFGETDNNIVYLAMEYIDGEPLATKLQRELALHPDVAADILSQSADALQAAHDMGILHRDLKPDNIMLAKKSDGTFNVKLVDFGIARTIDRGENKLTRTGFAVGTPEYMSPEQLAGDKLDARSDQYSLALVAFVALTGKDAFPAESSKESLIARLTSRPRTLQEAKHDVRWSAALQAIFDKALSPEPADRYATVHEFSEAMSTAISVMTPSQTAAIYRRALEQRLASVAMRTPHSDMSAILTPLEQMPIVTAEKPVQQASAAQEEKKAEAAAPSWVAAATAATKAKPKPVQPPQTPEMLAKRARNKQMMSRALTGLLIVGGLGVVGVAAYAFLADDPNTQVASADTLAAVPVTPPLDSAASVAVQATDTPRAPLPATPTPVPSTTARTLTPAEVADSVKRVQRDSVRKDSVARLDKARRDSIRRRAAAIETFPESAIASARTVTPNWRERMKVDNDVRVVLMTPQVSAWRADQARKWKETHVRSDGGPAYDVVDPIEAWSQWKRLVSVRRPVVVIEVKSERAPFDRVDPEKIFDFKRGDIQSIQLLRDGTAMSLLNVERVPAVVNEARHKEQGKAVPFSMVAITPPDAFAPRADGSWPKMEVVTTDGMNRGREVRLQLADAVVRRIYEDFASYRDALK